MSIAVIGGRARNSPPESVSTTAITTVGPTINAATAPGSAGTGNFLAITSGGAISCNGLIIGGSGVVELYYFNHTAYQFNGTSWFGPIIATGVGSAVANPVPTITSVTLSAASFVGSSASGTVVGSITVQTSGLGGVFAGTLSLTGTNASSFQIVGTNLETNGVIVAGSYAVNIVATQTSMAGSPFTQAETLTGTSAGISPPAQAVAAGFNASVFNSDFTSTSDVATTSGAASGAKWYWSGVNSTSQFSINTGAGSGVTAGATGVLTLLGSSVNFADALSSLPSSQNGATGTGTFKRGYFEARMQFGHLVAGAGSFAGWPSFWLFQSALGAASAGVMTSEVDIMESFPQGTGAVGNNSLFAHTMHNWLSSSAGYTATDEFNTNSNNFDSLHQGADDAWHIHGCLWTGSDTACQISFYLDNVLLTSPSGGGTQFFNFTTAQAMTAGMNALPPAHMIMHLGCATTGWPVNVDWVRVWAGSEFTSEFSTEFN